MSSESLRLTASLKCRLIFEIWRDSSGQQQKKFQELIYSRPKSGFISLKTQSSTVNLRLDTRSVLLKERWHVQVPLQKRHHLKFNTSKNDSLIVLLQSVITVRVKVGKTPRVEDPEIQNTGLGLHQLCDITVMSHRAAAGVKNKNKLTAEFGQGWAGSQRSRPN